MSIDVGVLGELIKKSRETETSIKNLRNQMLSALAIFQTPSEIILFEENSLHLKGIRYHNCMPKPTFIISGLKIIARPEHNNCFDDGVQCNIYLEIILDIDYISEEERRIHNEGRIPVWRCYLPSFTIRSEEFLSFGKKKIGFVISNSSSNSWDSSIMIEDFSEFQKIRKKLIKCYKEIGILSSCIE